jgi:hypothetical protein
MGAKGGQKAIVVSQNRQHTLNEPDIDKNT